MVKKNSLIFGVTLFGLGIVSIGIYLILQFQSNTIYESRLKGDWLAFSCSPAGNIDISSLFLIRPDGSEIKQITDNNLVVSMPSWSPDGEWLAFVNGGHLYKIHPDGSDLQPVSPDTYSSDMDKDTLPDWSPDGVWIAFIAFRLHDRTWDVYRVNTQDDELERLTSNLNAQRAVDWSPDGKWLTFAGSTPNAGQGIFMLSTVTQEVQILIDRADDHAWSPDGQTIVYSAVDDSGINLHLIRLEDRKTIPVTTVQDAANYPEWSPNGEWIIFSASTSTNGISQIYKVRPNGSDLTRITDNTCHAVSPVWFTFPQ